MKVVILAGGMGTRLREETEVRPKPLVDIGGRPILWHIMKIYAHYGLTDFIICLGYKGDLIKQYFQNYALLMSDVTFDMSSGQVQVHQNSAEPWRVTLVNTGEKTMTGGRIRRIAPYLRGEETFCLTYGDGVANVDIGQLLAFHRGHGAKATVTAVRPPARFGALKLDQDKVVSFEEKPIGENAYINGGFFVLSTTVLDRIDGDETMWEHAPLGSLVDDGQLRAWRHDGFWQPMDTLRDKIYLEDLWATGKAPWKTWE